MKINAAFHTAQGEGVSVYAAEVSDKIVIAKIGAFNTDCAPDTVLVSDSVLSCQPDLLFAETNFPEAIKAYQALIAASRCVVQEDLRRYRVDNVIDLDGYKDNGSEKYSIDTLNNGHRAVLGICLYYFRYALAVKNTARMDGIMTQLGNLYEEAAQNDGCLKRYFATF